MLGLIEAFVAISAVILTSRIAGRIPAMMLTAIAAAAGAFIMPPSASWEVENPADVLTIVVQSIVGLAVAYKWQPRVQRLQPAAATPLVQHRKEAAYSLLTIVPAVLARQGGLMGGLCDIQLCGELDGMISVSEAELDNLLSDVLHLAFSDPKTRRIKIYASRRPALNQITLVAEYNASAPLPRLRMIGRSDRQRPLEAQHWPANCSATVFDSQAARTYQISIQKTF